MVKRLSVLFSLVAVALFLSVAAASSVPNSDDSRPAPQPTATGDLTHVTDRISGRQRRRIKRCIRRHCKNAGADCAGDCVDLVLGY